MASSDLCKSSGVERDSGYATMRQTIRNFLVAASGIPTFLLAAAPVVAGATESALPSAVQRYEQNGLAIERPLLPLNSASGSGKEVDRRSTSHGQGRAHGCQEWISCGGIRPKGG